MRTIFERGDIVRVNIRRRDGKMHEPSLAVVLEFSGSSGSVQYSIAPIETVRKYGLENSGIAWFGPNEVEDASVEEKEYAKEILRQDKAKNKEPRNYYCQVTLLSPTREQDNLVVTLQTEEEYQSWQEIVMSIEEWYNFEMELVERFGDKV